MKVAIWGVLGTALSVAFACHFAPVMPLACYIFFWIMFCFTSLAIFYGLFLRRTRRSGVASLREVEGPSVQFRVMSDVENLDDGFKWRRNGKKSVKNNPFPRSYYRCATEGCSMKKWVQRDKDDSCCVIITYKGTYNHQAFL